MGRTRRTILAGLCACMVAACTTSGDTTPTPPAEKLVGDTVDEATVKVTAGTSAAVTLGDVTVDISGPSIAGDGELAIKQVKLEDDVELPEGFTAASDAFQVTLDGATLEGTAAVTFAVPEGFDGIDHFPGVLWQDDSGALAWTPAEWEPGEATITATLRHFSSGILGNFDVKAAAEKFAGDAANYLTGRAGVAQPSCGDEDAARSGLDVTSDGGDTVKWCYGIEDGQRILKVANNRRAYAEVDIPDGWEVVDGGRYGVSSGAVIRFLSDRAAEAVADETRNVRLLAGGDTLKIAVPDGAEGGVTVEMSVTAWLLSALQFGVEIYGSVVSSIPKLGVAASGRWSHFVRGMAGLESIGAWGDAARSCLKALTDDLTDQPLGPDAAWPLMKFVWDCIPGIMKADIEETGPAIFLLGTLLATVGTVVGAVLTAVNLLVSGTREIFDSIVSFGPDDVIYDIAIGSALPSAVPVTLGPVGALSATPTLMFVVDTSGSMGDPDSLGQVKIVGARTSLLDFLAEVDGDTRLGLRTYPSGAGDCASGRLRIPIGQRNTATMDATVRTLTPAGGTPTAEALVAAANDLRAAGSPNGTIILVSDGESGCADPCVAADDLRAAGLSIKVHTVALASSAGGVAELDCIAEKTGGRATSAGDTEELAAILAELSTPTISVDLDHPTSAIAEVGTSTGGLVDIVATVTNDSELRADDVNLRISFDGGAAAVVSPVRSVGNLEPGQDRTVTWQFQPSVTLAGSAVSFEVSAGGANVPASVSANGSVNILDATGRDDAGPLLRDAERIVILGDSYSSGEGTGDYLEGTGDDGNRCHRSSETYLMSEFDLDAELNLACSGAVAAQVTTTSQNGIPTQVLQLDRLQSDSGPADMVVLTIGGNDVGFGPLVKSCIFSPISCTNAIYGSDTDPYLDSRLAALPITLWETYGAIDAVLNRADRVQARGGRAPIVVLSYPRIFPGARRACSALTTIDQAEMDLGSDVVTRLNGAIEAAVSVSRTQGVPAFYVPAVEDAFLPSNTICDGDRAYVRSPETVRLSPDGTDMAEALKAGVTVGFFADDGVAGYRAFVRRSQELFHPNPAGYEAMTRAIVRWSLTDEAAAEFPPVRERPGPSVDVARPVDRISGVVSADSAPPALRAGATYTVQAGGFVPGSPVEIALQSRLRVLAVPNADDDGTISTDVVIPEGTVPGRHQIQMSGLAPDGEGTVTKVDVDVSAGATPLWRGWLAAGGPLLIVLLGAALLLGRWPRRHGEPAPRV